MASTARDIGLLLGVVAVSTALAELLGAANLGTALGFAQIAFAIGVVAVILRR